MEVFSSVSSASACLPPSSSWLGNDCTNYQKNIKQYSMKLRKSKRLEVKLSVTNQVSEIVADPAQPQVTWEIIVGTLAGVTPFVVAGIEFSKRIVAQRKCQVCKGSGLVLRDKKYYFRCPSCGGFLPWQSWRRFFWG